jgi:hypothetical protein
MKVGFFLNPQPAIEVIELIEVGSILAPTELFPVPKLGHHISDHSLYGKNI